MREVLAQAQKLAEAIKASDIWQNMHEAELRANADPVASQAMAALREKRLAVEDMLEDAGIDQKELQTAAAELKQAEKELNALPVMQEVRDRRAEFTQMMTNVNQLLQLVINGEITDGRTASRCSGSCAGCSGCS